MAGKMVDMLKQDNFYNFRPNSYKINLPLIIEM